MTEARHRSVLATMLFVGSILGAGVFGLPYAFAQTGWLIGFVLLVGLSALLLVLQLEHAEITIQTPGHRRLAGLAGRYLGPWGRYVTTLLVFGYGWGILVAYIILGGEFLATLFQPIFGGEVLLYHLAFILIEALLISCSLKRAAHFELVIGGLLLTLFAVLILSGLPAVDLTHLATRVTPAPEHLFLAYGVILFSASGVALMPEMHAVFGEKYEYRLPKAVVAGAAIIFLLYALFTLVVVGVTGPDTTQNALEGYAALIGRGMPAFAALIGLLTIGSIFLMVGEQLKDTFIFDFALPKSLAWGLTLIVPILLFFLGVRDFISVVSFTGAVFSALLACILLLVYERMRATICRRERCFLVPRSISVIIGVIFVLGALYEILTRFFL